MTAYVRLTPETGFRIVWTELKPGARSINRRDMPMTRAEWWQFCYMVREGVLRQRVGQRPYVLNGRFVPLRFRNQTAAPGPQRPRGDFL